MSNMSYCRFENTLVDFRDCASAFEEIVDRGDDPLAGDELRSAVQLIGDAADLLNIVAQALGLENDCAVLDALADPCQRDSIRSLLDGRNAEVA